MARNAHVILLAVVAVLLAANLLKPTPTAQAEKLTGPTEPYVVKWLPVGASYVRVWSDGMTDFWQRVGPSGACDFQFVGVGNAPVQHPHPVVDAQINAGGVTIEYADGRVDLVITDGSGGRCTINGEGSPLACLGDTDRSGEIDFDDLVRVLSEWGVCE